MPSARPRTNKLTLTAPGSVLDLAARKHRINLGLDPSPKAFVTRSMAGHGAIGVTIRPQGQNKELAPIELRVKVKSLVLKLEDCLLADSTRLNDLIYLVNDEKAEVEIDLTADPQGELFEDHDENEDETQKPGAA